jgi:hypothetical protein
MNEEKKNDTEGFEKDALKQLEKSKECFRIPDGYFESRSALLESALQRDFEVPSDYFEEQTNELEKTLLASSNSNGQRSIRLWASLAAAAMMAGFVYLLIVNDNETPTFSEQLEQTPLEFEDLEEVEFEEDVYEEFIILDTINPDTVSTKKSPVSVQDFKPSKGQSVISWDDIDAADIEEYLNDEESLEIIDEL